MYIFQRIGGLIPSCQGNDHRQRVRKFSFDSCFTSLEDGHCNGISDQEKVYKDLGTSVLASVLQGYNTCVLAYGQSGSGKTYTMMGQKVEPGLTPRICQGLFKHMETVAEKKLTFKTEVSFLEIYNEHVHDLLHPKRRKCRLRVREHPRFGPFVEGLTKHIVTDIDSLLNLIRRGNENRCIAATHIHDRSSRSHAVFTIRCSQMRLDKDKPSETESKLHLVDLAGSERANVRCNSRLKEGANINKSLVTLGSVISVLVEKSKLQHDNKRKHRPSFVPYRNSVLTWLLKDSLGGNALTFLIATISPSSMCYQETLSTLHYAQQAKNILNRPVVNEDPTTKLICELKAEVSRLKLLLAGESMAKPLAQQQIERWHETFQALIQCPRCCSNIRQRFTSFKKNWPHFEMPKNLQLSAKGNVGNWNATSHWRSKCCSHKRSRKKLSGSLDMENVVTRQTPHFASCPDLCSFAPHISFLLAEHNAHHCIIRALQRTQFPEDKSTHIDVKHGPKSNCSFQHSQVCADSFCKNPCAASDQTSFSKQRTFSPTNENTSVITIGQHRPAHLTERTASVPSQTEKSIQMSSSAQITGECTTSCQEDALSFPEMPKQRHVHSTFNLSLLNGSDCFDDSTLVPQSCKTVQASQHNPAEVHAVPNLPKRMLCLISPLIVPEHVAHSVKLACYDRTAPTCPDAVQSYSNNGRLLPGGTVMNESLSVNERFDITKNQTLIQPPMGFHDQPLPRNLYEIEANHKPIPDNATCTTYMEFNKVPEVTDLPLEPFSECFSRYLKQSCPTSTDAVHKIYETYVAWPLSSENDEAFVAQPDMTIGNSSSSFNASISCKNFSPKPEADFCKTLPHIQELEVSETNSYGKNMADGYFSNQYVWSDSKTIESLPEHTVNTGHLLNMVVDNPHRLPLNPIPGISSECHLSGEDETACKTFSSLNDPAGKDTVLKMGRGSSEVATSFKGLHETSVDKVTTVNGYRCFNQFNAGSDMVDSLAVTLPGNNVEGSKFAESCINKMEATISGSPPAQLLLGDNAKLGDSFPFFSTNGIADLAPECSYRECFALDSSQENSLDSLELNDDSMYVDHKVASAINTCEREPPNPLLHHDTTSIEAQGLWALSASPAPDGVQVDTEFGDFKSNMSSSGSEKFADAEESADSSLHSSTDSITYVFISRNYIKEPTASNSQDYTQDKSFIDSKCAKATLSLDSLERNIFSTNDNHSDFSPRTLSVDSLVLEECLSSLCTCNNVPASKKYGHKSQESRRFVQNIETATPTNKPTSDTPDYFQPEFMDKVYLSGSESWPKSKKPGLSKIKGMDKSSSPQTFTTQKENKAHSQVHETLSDKFGEKRMFHSSSLMDNEQTKQRSEVKNTHSISSGTALPQVSCSYLHEHAGHGKTQRTTLYQSKHVEHEPAFEHIVQNHLSEHPEDGEAKDHKLGNEATSTPSTQDKQYPLSDVIEVVSGLLDALKTVMDINSRKASNVKLNGNEAHREPTNLPLTVPSTADALPTGACHQKYSTNTMQDSGFCGSGTYQFEANHVCNIDSAHERKNDGKTLCLDTYTQTPPENAWQPHYELSEDVLRELCKLRQERQKIEKLLAASKHNVQKLHTETVHCRRTCKDLSLEPFLTSSCDSACDIEMGKQKQMFAVPNVKLPTPCGSYTDRSSTWPCSKISSANSDVRDVQLTSTHLREPVTDSVSYCSTAGLRRCNLEQKCKGVTLSQRVDQENMFASHNSLGVETSAKAKNMYKWWNKEGSQHCRADYLTSSEGSSSPGLLKPYSHMKYSHPCFEEETLIDSTSSFDYHGHNSETKMENCCSGPPESLHTSTDSGAFSSLSLLQNGKGIVGQSCFSKECDASSDLGTMIQKQLYSIELENHGHNSVESSKPSFKPCQFSANTSQEGTSVQYPTENVREKRRQANMQYPSREAHGQPEEIWYTSAVLQKQTGGVPDKPVTRNAASSHDTNATSLWNPLREVQPQQATFKWSTRLASAANVPYCVSSRDNIDLDDLFPSDCFQSLPHTLPRSYICLST